jgi:chromate transporter
MKMLEFLVVIFTANVLALGNAPLMFPLLRRSLVVDRPLLTDDQLLYAYAVARVTPGQANLYVASLGYMVAGLAGAVLAIIAVAGPSYIMVPMLQSYERFRTSREIQGAIRGLTAVSVGLIFASTVEVARDSVTGVVAGMVFLLAFVLNQFLRWNPFLSLGVGSAVGFALHLLAATSWAPALSSLLTK